MTLRAPCVNGLESGAGLQKAAVLPPPSQHSNCWAKSSTEVSRYDKYKYCTCSAFRRGRALQGMDSQLCQRYFSSLSQGRCILPQNVCSPGNWSSVLICRWWGRPDNLLHRRTAGVQSCLSLLLNVISIHLSENTNFISPQKC